MKRISLTIPEPVLKQLDEYIATFQTGELRGNRSAYIAALIKSNTPSIEG